MHTISREPIIVISTDTNVILLLSHYFFTYPIFFIIHSINYRFYNLYIMFYLYLFLFYIFCTSHNNYISLCTHLNVRFYSIGDFKYNYIFLKIFFASNFRIHLWVIGYWKFAEFFRIQ